MRRWSEAASVRRVDAAVTALKNGLYYHLDRARALLDCAITLGDAYRAFVRRQLYFRNPSRSTPTDAENLAPWGLELLSTHKTTPSIRKT